MKKKIGTSTGVAGASSSDEFAKGNTPPNIDVIEGKAVIVQSCVTFPTSHLSSSHSIRIIVAQRREFRIDDPNKSGSNDDLRDDGRRQLMIFAIR